MAQIDCNAFSDSQLVNKSIDNQAYFACLYNRYEAKLLRYIHRLSDLSDDEALDILQEAFIKVWVNINDFDPELSFNSWIYRIVHHETISVWRKKTSFNKNNTLDFNKLNETLTNDDELDNEEHEKKIQLLINLLPENYKSVLVLKFFEDKSYEEISDILKIPEGTVATRLNRAKKTFQELTEQHHISFFD